METSKQYFWGDYLIAGGIVVIGLTEAAHLTSVFFGRSFSDCAAILLLLLAVFAAVLAFFLVRSRRKRHSAKTDRKPADRAERILSGIFCCILLSQLYFIVTAGGEYRQGDMTVETVGSFLETDAVYSVNPMTGQPYTAGIPSRLKILCLPTLYACISRITGLEPQLVVRRLVPAATLFACYAAYYALARCLFRKAGPETVSSDRKKRGGFLIAVAMLLWAGNYMYGMDGFGVLSCGFRGVTIRNAVLVPWLLSLCLRKKWKTALLCILAEACIVWTFYGLGVCAAVTAGMAAAGLILRMTKARKGEAK